MSPGEKRQVILSLVAVLGLSITGLLLYLLPEFVLASVGGAACVAWFWNRTHLRKGLVCSRGVSLLLQLPPSVRRWIPLRGLNGGSRTVGRPVRQGFRGVRFTGTERFWENLRLFGTEEFVHPEEHRDVLSPRDLLMGSYLGKPDKPSSHLEAGKVACLELRELLARPNHVVPSPTRRLSFGESVIMSNRFTIVPRRRYPIQQSQFALLGTLPAVRWDGFQKKTVLSPRKSAMVHSPVRVRIARPDPSIMRSPVLEQLPCPSLNRPPLGCPDPCARETVLSALKERRKRGVEEEASASDQENKRRRHDSSGSGHSAFEPLVANGAPASLVPKPGTLKRDSSSQAFEDPLLKRSRTSSVSSMSSSVAGGISSARNAISSSYSSSWELNKARKNIRVNTSPLSSNESSRSETPEKPSKKLRAEEASDSNTSTPVKKDKLERGQLKESAKTFLQSTSAPTSTSEGDGKRRRKVPLLPVRKEPLILPPPPQLGYTVTADDLDNEKRMELERIKKAFEEKPEKGKTSASTGMTTQLSTSSVLTLAPSSSGKDAVAAAVSAAVTVASPFQESTKVHSSGSPAFADSSAAATPPTSDIPENASGSLAGAAPVTQAVTSVPVQSTSLLNSTFSLTSSPSVQTNSTVCSSFPANQMQVPISSSFTPASDSKGQTVSTTANISPLCFSSSTTTSSVFKPVFVTASAVQSSTTLALATPTIASPSTTTTTFNPILSSSSSSSVTSSAASPFTFGQSSQLATTNAFNPPVSTSSSCVFPALGHTEKNGPDAVTKSKVSFGLGTLSSGSSGTGSGNQSVFQFGVATSSAATTTASGLDTNTSFQFGKPAVQTTASQSTSMFGQPGSSTQTSNVASSNTFSGFNSTSTASSVASSSQPAFSFGVPAFGSSTNMPHSGTAGQPGFLGSTSTQQTSGKTAASQFNFGSAVTPFTFGGNSAQPTSQPVFGTVTQPAFAGTTSQLSFGVGTGQSTSGITSSVFSFGTSTSSTVASTFGSNTQTSSTKAATGSIFSATNVGFSFGGATQSTGTNAFGMESSTTAAPSGGFTFGSGQASAPSVAAAFGGASGSQFSSSTNQASQNFSTFTFGATNATENKSTFGGNATPAFGQSSAGGGFSFGTPSTTAPSFGGIPSTQLGSPAFSIGSGSKVSGARQRLQARRQHLRKK